MSMTVAALIVAAGRGTRMGSPTPKAFLPLGGVPILARAVAAFSAHPRIGLVVAVVSDLDAARRALGEAAARVVLVAGGPERQDSVRLGLEVAYAVQKLYPGKIDFELSKQLIGNRKVIDALKAGDGESPIALICIDELARALKWRDLNRCIDDYGFGS